MESDSTSLGPPFTALSVPPMGEGVAFRGPSIKAYRHGASTPVRFGPRRATTVGAHVPVMASAPVAAPAPAAPVAPAPRAAPHLGVMVDVRAA